MTRVIIIGGGLAGLAAAVKLAPTCAVTILEARPRLGGRASSFTDPVTGTLVDACQHVSMGCCTAFKEFCATVGVARYLEPQPCLYFMTPDCRVSRFRRDPWPAPFHLGRALASAHYLSATEKMRIAWGLLKLWRTKPEADGSLIKFLRTHRQTLRCIDRFWRVVLTSALNESVETLGLKYARKVFVDAFLTNRDGFVVELPSVPLGRLYGDEMMAWLEKHGVEVRLNTAVKKVTASPPTASVGTPPTPANGPAGPPTDAVGGLERMEIELRDGTLLKADRVILAVPFERVADLVPITIPLEPSPITSVHFWFDRDVLAYPHVVLIDCLGQWIFRRPGGYLQVVVSASEELRKLGREEIEQRIRAELLRLFPALASAVLLRSKVVTEHHATFRAVPGVDALRPSQTTNIPGLYLAGDYTQTGWPATMEGAVISGNRAAEVLLARRASEGLRILS